MTWTRAVGLGAGLALLSGCVYGYRSVALQGRYSTASRPDASYYCYDCHGYRFFDPYYDWCASYGFRYRWARYPRMIALYRERYVGIRESHPEYGGYRYRPGYRASSRYRDERDYESWRREHERKSRPGERGFKGKEKSREAEPRDQEKRPHKREREDPKKGSPRRGG